MEIWVIGNGESRRGVALNQLNGHIIGCNAVHRDHRCDEFVAVDRRMVDEILRNEASGDGIIYTRPDWSNNWTSQRVRSLAPIPFEGPNKVDQSFHWNSGPHAVLLACSHRPTVVNLLGFDLWGNGNLVNNYYKDTENYSKSTTKKIIPDFWVYQLASLFKFYSEIEFIQHQKQEWTIPKEWMDIKNLTIKYDIV